MLEASKTGLPEGKESEVADSNVAVEQYCEQYTPVAGGGLKLLCSAEMLLLSNCSSGVS